MRIIVFALLAFAFIGAARAQGGGGALPNASPLSTAGPDTLGTPAITSAGGGGTPPTPPAAGAAALYTQGSAMGKSKKYPPSAHAGAVYHYH